MAQMYARQDLNFEWENRFELGFGKGPNTINCELGVFTGLRP
jgi:hypothetical protein